jgi:hypothetical protein
VPHLVTERQRTVVESLLVLRPVRDVLKAFAAGIEELLYIDGASFRC